MICACLTFSSHSSTLIILRLEWDAGDVFCFGFFNAFAAFPDRGEEREFEEERRGLLDFRLEEEDGFGDIGFSGTMGRGTAAFGIRVILCLLLDGSLVKVDVDPFTLTMGMVGRPTRKDVCASQSRGVSWGAGWAILYNPFFFGE